MHKKFWIALLTATVIAACSREDTVDLATTIDYPESTTVEHVDNYHGIEIADPFRWLEDDVRESDAVKGWVDAQNAVTFAYLATIPERDQIANRMRELWDYERFSLPRKAGGRYFSATTMVCRTRTFSLNKTALMGSRSF